MIEKIMNLLYQSKKSKGIWNVLGDPYPGAKVRVKTRKAELLVVFDDKGRGVSFTAPYEQNREREIAKQFMNALNSINWDI